ncbi:MAG TPA: lipopolysaccharide heptosyltransferase II [Candidatus Eisenbacteria bacterium]|nr:lipopolysaccharide heptosyltransferase II [Candidatus Eisenbacteria bacterium]
MPTPGAGPLLVRLPNWLGDLVLAWPVLDAAAREAVLFVGPAAFEPLVLARFPSARYLAWRREARYALVGEMRRARPRAALLLTDSFSSALLARLAGVPERIGYAAEWRGPLLTRRVAREAASRAVARTDEYRVLARAAGLAAAAGAPSLTVTPGEREAARDLLAAAGLAADAKPVVVAPGAAYGPAKQWGVERFADAAAAIATPRGLPVVTVGAPSDAAAGAAVATRLRAAGAGAHDLTGRTDLTSLAGVLAAASLVLSNDSGVMHLAAALGRPTVAVFGSTSPVWTSASAPWVANLYAAYPCSPCFRRTCPIGYGCLRAIAPSRAVEAASRLLS